MANRKIYRTMQGKIIDLDKLAAKNELAPAIGNMRVNARGDELGPGGKIVRKREDVMAEYYENNPNAVADEVFKKTAPTNNTVVEEKEKRTSTRKEKEQE